MCNADAPNKPSEHMKMAQESSLEDAVLKWYVQQRSCSVNVQWVELKSAANMKINFKMDDGWLWRFCKRHGIMNKRTYGEALSAPLEEIEPFRQKLTKIF
jgi:hypothetical protein